MINARTNDFEDGHFSTSRKLPCSEVMDTAKLLLISVVKPLAILVVPFCEETRINKYQQIRGSTGGKMGKFGVT